MKFLAGQCGVRYSQTICHFLRSVRPPWQSELLPAYFANQRAVGTLRYWKKDGYQWDLSTRGYIFLIPSIQCLTVINAISGSGYMSQLRESNAFTSLEELHFLHCRIDPSNLGEILRLPSALKGLTIAESGSLPPEDPNDYIGSMHRQWNTLKSLILIRKGRSESRQIRLQRLSKLSYLEIQPQVIFIGLNVHPPFSLPPVPLFQFILPPNLEELVLTGIQNPHYRSLGMLFEILEDLFHDKLSKGLFHTLKRVALVFSGESLEVPASVYAAAQAAEVDLVTLTEDPRQLVNHKV
jgi:hypothetical protein